MAAGRRRETWHHTALLATIQAEMNRDRKKRPQAFTEADFHPDGAAAYRSDPATSRRPMTEADRELLREVFPKG